MTVNKKKRNAMRLTQDWSDRRGAKLDKLIVERFDASFMSDAKWRKALALLACRDYPISRYRWKFVDEEKVFETPVIEAGEIGERNINDGRNQPFAYREVEWLEVMTEHVEEVGKQLLARAKFALEESESGIRVIGYRRRASQRTAPDPRHE